MKQLKKKTCFGYRYHLLADVNYELPIEYTVTKTSIGERVEFKKHINMLDIDKVEKIETALADKGYDSEDMIVFLQNKGIKPVIDIRNHWKYESTKQYKDTDLIYTYDGKVSIVEENGEVISLKYLGYDKVKNTLRYQYKNKVYSIDINYDKRIFTGVARDSKKWQNI